MAERVVVARNWRSSGRRRRREELVRGLRVCVKKSEQFVYETLRYAIFQSISDGYSGDTDAISGRYTCNTRVTVSHSERNYYPVSVVPGQRRLRSPHCCE